MPSENELPLDREDIDVESLDDLNESNSSMSSATINSHDLMAEIRSIKSSIELIQDELSEDQLFVVFSKQLLPKDIKPYMQTRAVFTWICLLFFLALGGMFTVRYCWYIWNLTDDQIAKVNEAVNSHIPVQDK